MTAKTKVEPREDPASAARACLTDIPYRMVVFKERNHHGKPLYLVAGSPIGACGAEKALKAAHKVHGGRCFYCKKEVSEDQVTIDHAEPKALAGTDDLQNLLIACKPCNATKGIQRIEFFNPNAGREWLSALLMQVQERLNRLG